MKAISCYVFLGGLTQISSSVISAQKHNNLWVLHLYTPLEFACIIWFYSIVLAGYIKKTWFLLLGLVFLVLSGFNSMFIQAIDSFNTYARSLEGFLTILLCLTWCYQTLVEMKIRQLEKDPVFWVNTGFLLYFSGTVLLFAFSNYIVDLNRALNLYIWAFHALFSILLYLFITVGLWVAK
ncbi:MAG: hypothetical protein ACKVT2_18085 [Saprospiraceae bacterium]